jgi:hypothetical protein
VGVVWELIGEGGRRLGVGATIGVGWRCGGAGGRGGGVGVLGLWAAGRGFGMLGCCCFALEVAAQEADCTISDDADGFTKAGSRAWEC